MTTCAFVDTPPLFETVEERGTLDELIASLWEGLRGDRVVACPVCGASMKPEYGVHARAIGGSCSMCGSSLR